MNNNPTTRNRTATASRLSVLFDREIKTKLMRAAADSRRSLTAELEVAALEHLRAIEANKPQVFC